MAFHKNITTARHSFSIAKNFLRNERMQHEFINRRKEIIEQVMNVIRGSDREIDVNDKLEAINLLQYFANDTQSQQILKNYQVEDRLLEVLKHPQAQPNVLNAAVRALLMIYSASLTAIRIKQAIEGQNLSTQEIEATRLGKALFTRDGITLLNQIVEYQLHEDEQNWDLLINILRLYYVIAFRERACKLLKQENIISAITRLQIKAREQQKDLAIVAILRLYTFFSDDQLIWPSIIVRETIRSIFDAITTPDKVNKKFFLAVLYDFCSSQLAIKLIKEHSWNEGIDALIKYCFDSEPLVVSLILSILYKDIVVRSQIHTMMTEDHIADILNAKGEQVEWLDPIIPAHIKRIQSQSNLAQYMYNNNTSPEELYAQALANNYDEGQQFKFSRPQQLTSTIAAQNRSQRPPSQLSALNRNRSEARELALNKPRPLTDIRRPELQDTKPLTQQNLNQLKITDGKSQKFTTLQNVQDPFMAKFISNINADDLNVKQQFFANGRGPAEAQLVHLNPNPHMYKDQRALNPVEAEDVKPLDSYSVNAEGKRLKQEREQFGVADTTSQNNQFKDVSDLQRAQARAESEPKMSEFYSQRMAMQQRQIKNRQTASNVNQTDPNHPNRLAYQQKY